MSSSDGAARLRLTSWTGTANTEVARTATVASRAKIMASVVEMMVRVVYSCSKERRGPKTEELEDLRVPDRFITRRAIHDEKWWDNDGLSGQVTQFKSV
jgi:hypothetical protein